MIHTNSNPDADRHPKGQTHLFKTPFFKIPVPEFPSLLSWPGGDGRLSLSAPRGWFLPLGGRMRWEVVQYIDDIPPEMGMMNGLLRLPFAGKMLTINQFRIIWGYSVSFLVKSPHTIHIGLRRLNVVVIWCVPPGHWRLGSISVTLKVAGVQILHIVAAVHRLLSSCG